MSRISHQGELPRQRLALLVLLGLASSGCFQDRFWEAPWASGLAKAVILTDPQDQPLGSWVGIFGPSDPIEFSIDSEVPVRVHVRLFPATIEGRPLSECGLSLGGEGEAVAPGLLVKAYVTDPVQLSAEQLPPFHEAEEPLPNFDLRYQRCTPSQAICGRTEAAVVPYETPPDAAITPLVTVSDHVAFFGIDQVAPLEGFDLRRLEGDRVESIPGPPTFLRRILSLAFDGTQVLGTTKAGQRFTVSLDGVLTDSASQSAGLNQVAAGNGWVVDYGPAGIRSRVGPPLPPLPEPDVQDVLFLGPTQLAVLTSSAVYSYDGSWTKELTFNATESWIHLGGTAAGWGVVSSSNGIRLKAPSQPVPNWSEPLQPFYGRSAYQLVAIGADRFLVGGQNGTLAVLDQGHFCTIDPITANAITSIKVAPSGRFAFASTNELGYVPGDHAILLRLTIPE